MRRIVVAATAALVALAVASPADAAKKPAKPKKRTRTVTIDYRVGPVVNVDGVASGMVCRLGGVDIASCTSIPLKPDEAYVKFAATDTTGQPVPLHWHAAPKDALPTNSDPNGYDSVESGCGSAAGKIKKPKFVNVYVGPSIPDCAIATAGKITVTISNMP